MGVAENFTGLIQRTSESFIRDNIYMIDKPLLAKALKFVEPQYQEKIFRNMTIDGAEEVKRRMVNLGDINKEEAEAAQQEILSMVQGYI